MKRHHVLVANGDHPIPPPAWGAVEHVIWSIVVRLRRRDIPVHIVNCWKWKAIFSVLWLSLRGEADVVFCHAEKPVWLLAKLARWRNFLLVARTHNPISPNNLDFGATKALRRSSHAPYQFVGRTDIESLILALNPAAKCALQLNGVEVEEFEVSPQGNGRAICLGRIQERKRQNETALALQGSGIECDFVGPLLEEIPVSDYLRTQLKGEWDRETIHRRLCEYSCLILMSQSEQQPLVVIEALAAGIPVVVSPEAAGNLDLTKPFIFVVESMDLLPDTVRKAMALRDEMTQEIRQYAEATFDYETLVDNYLAQVEEWISLRK